jgi:hypothetical protein
MWFHPYQTMGFWGMGFRKELPVKKWSFQSEKSSENVWGTYLGIHQQKHCFLFLGDIWIFFPHGTSKNQLRPSLNSVTAQSVPAQLNGKRKRKLSGEIGACTRPKIVYNHTLGLPHEIFGCFQGLVNFALLQGPYKTAC